MISTSQVIALPGSPTTTLFEKSSAFGWERTIRRGLLVLMIGIGIGGSIWGFNQEIDKEKAKAIQAFETRSLQQTAAIRSHLENTLAAMKSAITDDYQTSKDAEKDEQQLIFKMKRLLNQQQVTQSAGWAPKTNEGQFPIKAVVYSPFYGARADQLTQGTDLALTPVINQAMNEAIKSGHITLAHLANEKGAKGIEGIAALIPAYRSNHQATRQQRIDNLQGFVIATLDISAIIEVGLQKANLYDMVTAQTLFDTGHQDGWTEIYNRQSEQFNTASGELLPYHDVAIITGGLTWVLRLAAPYSAYGKPIPTSAWVVLTVGLLITAILSAFVASLTRSARRIEKIVNKRTAELKEAHEKVRQSEMMLIQAEKLSSLGEMVAGVAHEINTPLGFIRCNLEMMTEQLTDLQTACSDSARTPVEQDPAAAQDEDNQSQHPLMDYYSDGRLDDLASMVAETTHGIERISDIVVSLKDFSRMDRLSFDEVDIHHCIDTTLNIAHNKIKHKAKITKDYGKLPLVSCSSGQLNQVLLNIIINAAQSIEGYGEIVISTQSQGDKVSISIQDNGKGMSEDIQKKIFQPFFTTKDIGQGTGLGLSISERIIRQHHGEILIDSTEGLGTIFTILLPIEQALSKAA